LQNYLANRSVAKQFLAAFHRFEPLIKPTVKYCHLVTQTVDYVFAVRDWLINKLSGTLDRAKQVKSSWQEMQEAKQDMNVVINICNELVSLAPPVIREYFAFNLEAFLAADKATTLIANYCRQLDERWEEITKLCNAIDRSNQTMMDGTNFSKDSNNRGMDNFIWPKK